MITLQFICPGCGREFALTYEDSKKGIRCTICGREKLDRELTEHENRQILKCALETGDAKYTVKVSIIK